MGGLFSRYRGKMYFKSNGFFSFLYHLLEFMFLEADLNRCGASFITTECRKSTQSLAILIDVCCTRITIIQAFQVVFNLRKPYGKKKKYDFSGKIV